MAEDRRITKEHLLEHFDDNEMDLGMSNLSTVPVKELVQIPRITKLDLSRNHLTFLPENISSLKTILELDLSKNQLTELPATFGELAQLQKLDLYGNKLSDLPLSFVELSRLQWLDLTKNPMNLALAKAAGTCVNKTECRQCAKNVMAYMRNIATETEKKKKKNNERKLARERKKQEEEKRKKEAARREKQELRRRRKEERERQQAESAADVLPDSQGEDTGGSTGEESEKKSTRDKSSRCLCKLFLLLMSVLVILSVCFFLYCDTVLDTALCRELYHNASTSFQHALKLTGQLTGLPTAV